MKMQKIIVSRARSAQHTPGILIPEDAEVVLGSVSLDAAEEHGSLLYITREVVDVEDDGSSQS